MRSTRGTMKRLFTNGTPLRPLHLLAKNGQPAEWAVQVRTGPLLDLHFLGHRVRCRLEGKQVLGCHVLRKSYQRGNFRIVSCKTMTAVAHDGPGIASRLTAELRTTDYPHLVVGKLYFELLGRPRFAGYFTLRKRGDRRMSPPVRAKK